MKGGYDKNEKKNFYIKSSSLLLYHIIAPYHFGTCDKKMTLNLNRLNV